MLVLYLNVWLKNTVFQDTIRLRFAKSNSKVIVCDIKYLKLFCILIKVVRNSSFNLKPVSSVSPTLA